MSELTQIAQMGKDLFDAQAEVLLKEAELKQAKRVLYQIQEVDIPEYMDEIGLTKFETADVSVEITDSLRVAPLAANRPKVMQVVTEAGDAHLIKDTISFMFTKGQNDAAEKFYDEAIAEGKAPKREQKIESSTLRAYVKGKLEAGEDIDMELFGVVMAKKAVFKTGAPVAPVFE
jgi:hypothetical protein